MTTTAPLLLNLADAAAHLGGVSVRTVRRLIEAGDLPTVRVLGRITIPAAALESWIANQIRSKHNDRRAGHPPKETQRCPTI